MAKRQGGGESLAVDVYEQLRSDIFDRRFQPGVRLLPTELCERFGVGVGVIREALALLAERRLVRIARNRGFHVAALSSAALGDLTEARRLNEGAAIRLSVRRGDVAWESRLLAAHHLMGSVRKHERARAHVAFHETLLAACGNEVLLDICHRLSDVGELYRVWSPHGDAPQHDIGGEHEALLRAALEHDAEFAGSLLEAHITTPGLRADAVLIDTEPGRRSGQAVPTSGGLGIE